MQRNCFLLQCSSVLPCFSFFSDFRGVKLRQKSLPETSSKTHLKMDGWNAIVSFWAKGLFSAKGIPPYITTPMPKQGLIEDVSSQKKWGGAWNGYS